MAIAENISLSTALQSGEVEKVEMAMQQFAQRTQDEILAKTENLIGNQEALEQASGIKLTGDERNFFMELIGEEGKVSPNAMATVPTTIVNRVFDGLTKEHKLLGLVDQAMVGLSTEWIFSIGVNPASNAYFINKNGKNAITHFKVLERFKDYTLLKVNIETGRTHQIRVHLAEIGYPIVGDYVYSNGKNPFNVVGQMLHSYRLEFKHPITGKKIKLEAELPEYMKEIINGD